MGASIERQQVDLYSSTQKQVARLEKRERRWGLVREIGRKGSIASCGTSILGLVGVRIATYPETGEFMREFMSHNSQIVFGETALKVFVAGCVVSVVNALISMKADDLVYDNKEAKEKLMEMPTHKSF